MLQARYLFFLYRKHPEIAPVEANDNLISQFAEEHILSLELLNTWEICARALEGQLARNTARTEVQPTVIAETSAEAPEPTDLRKLSVPELRQKWSNRSE